MLLVLWLLVIAHHTDCSCSFSLLLLLLLLLLTQISQDNTVSTLNTYFVPRKSNEGMNQRTTKMYSQYD